MKKLFYFAFAALAFVACSNDDTNNDPVVEAAKIEVTTDVATLAIPHEGGEVEVAFTTNKDWKATNTDNVEGLEIDPTFGAAGENTIKVKVGENTTEGERTLNVTLKAEEAEQVVAIKQLFEAAPYLTHNLPEYESVWATYEAQTYTLEIDANVEYEVVLYNEDASWVSMTDNGDGTYTFTLEANAGGSYRSVVGGIVSEYYGEDEELPFYIFQEGVAKREWTNVVRDLEGYNADAPCDLALMGDYLLVSNVSNIFVLNAANGEYVSTLALPEGVTAQSIEVDEGGNLLICSTPVEAVVTVYTTKSVDAAPAELLKFHTGNAYGGGYGNIRVAGNIDTEALLFLNIAGYWTDAGNTVGLVAAYEIANGAATLDANGWAQFTWVEHAAASNAATRCCAHPLGTSLTDGALFVAYTPSMYRAADASVRPVAYTKLAVLDASGWMENHACIDVVEVNGKKIAGTIASCFFDYDQPDLELIDLESNTVIGEVCVYDPTSETMDYVAAFKAAGESADVVLVPTENGVLAYSTDGVWGAVTCVSYVIL